MSFSIRVERKFAQMISRVRKGDKFPRTGCIKFICSREINYEINF